jgi:hypothetical protein
MRLYMPFIFIIVFILYVLYLAIIKKTLKQNLTKVVYPGVFFILVWIVIYYLALK